MALSVGHPFYINCNNCRLGLSRMHWRGTAERGEPPSTPPCRRASGQVAWRPLLSSPAEQNSERPPGVGIHQAYGPTNTSSASTLYQFYFAAVSRCETRDDQWAMFPNPDPSRARAIPSRPNIQCWWYQIKRPEKRKTPPRPTAAALHAPTVLTSLFPGLTADRRSMPPAHCHSRELSQRLPDGLDGPAQLLFGNHQGRRKPDDVTMRGFRLGPDSQHFLLSQKASR